MECAMREEDGSRCSGPIDAHHKTGAGLALKANDRETIPLCHGHHMDFHAQRGCFRNWDKARRKDWQGAMIAHYWPDDLDGRELPF
jgi:hypothetical protein